MKILILVFFTMSGRAFAAEDALSVAYGIGWNLTPAEQKKLVLFDSNLQNLIEHETRRLGKGGPVDPQAQQMLNSRVRLLRTCARSKLLLKEIVACKWGSGSTQAFGDGSIAYGTDVKAFNGAVALGSGSLASGKGALASGAGAVAVGRGAIAIGPGPQACGNKAVAYGAGGVAIGPYACSCRSTWAIGPYTTSGAVNMRSDAAFATYCAPILPTGAQGRIIVPTLDMGYWFSAGTPKYPQWAPACCGLRPRVKNDTADWAPLPLLPPQETASGPQDQDQDSEEAQAPPPATQDEDAAPQPPVAVAPQFSPVAAALDYPDVEAAPIYYLTEQRRRDKDHDKDQDKDKKDKQDKGKPEPPPEPPKDKDVQDKGLSSKDIGDQSKSKP